MNSASASGHLAKMPVALTANRVAYQLPLDDQLVDLNPLLGQKIRLTYTGNIRCVHCGRRTNKSFNQGYCYPCFIRLAQCDSCIVSPEKCHFHLGTCREPDWAQQYCMSDHIVYLANSSGVKVGITRASQLPTRWIDQGAVQALPIMRVKTRQQSGLVEDLLRQHVADKTNWRTMLKGDIAPIDLAMMRDKLFDLCSLGLGELTQRFGIDAIRQLDDQPITEIDYPVLEYPQKISSFNLDKDTTAEGTLLGIKGQYLIFDSGVINVRKYTAYHVELSA